MAGKRTAMRGGSSKIGRRDFNRGEVCATTVILDIIREEYLTRVEAR
jgi:hypothetical protein